MMPPSALRVAEVVMYTVLSTVPFVLLGVYPFRQQYRFPRGVTIALLVLVTGVQICLRTAAACITVPWTDDAKAWCTGLSSLLYAAVYFLLFRAHPGKLLFTLLMLSNIAALAVIDGKCLEGLLFGQELARQSYRWTASAAMASVLVLLLVPLFLYFRRCYAPPCIWRWESTRGGICGWCRPPSICCGSASATAVSAPPWTSRWTPPRPV